MKKDARHRAREAALQILYHAEIGRSDMRQAIATYFDLQWPDEGPVPEAVRTFAADLATDTIRQLPVVDPLIADTTERWRPERMPILDRLILRMATTELLRADSPPPAVVINEALELARTFSTDESVKFINGMLDAIRKKIER